MNTEKFRIVRYADLAKGFDGYNWIEVPNSNWAQGGYFDGRGQAFATPFTTQEAAQNRANQIGDCEVLPLKSI